MRTPWPDSSGSSAGARVVMDRPYVTAPTPIPPLGHTCAVPDSPTLRPDATDQLTAALTERILVMDGAMGTMIQREGLGEAEYRGDRFADWASDLKGNNDLLSLTQPDIIRGIHTAYLEAGADLIETNTFNAQRISLADYGMQDLAYEINVAAARLAREAADAMTART